MQWNHIIEMDREMHKDRLKFTVKDKDILHFVNKNTYLIHSHIFPSFFPFMCILHQLNIHRSIAQERVDILHRSRLKMPKRCNNNISSSILKKPSSWEKVPLNCLLPHSWVISRTQNHRTSSVSRPWPAAFRYYRLPYGRSRSVWTQCL